MALAGRRVRLELAYFSGSARLLEFRMGGAGAILRFERVRPARRDGFQPLRSHEITPQFLERVLRALRRWKYDVVSADEAVRRAAEPRTGRRFVWLTFDGAYRDMIAHAYPVLARHDVPFTVYLPTGFVDGIAQMWWLALEQVVARNDRISLVMARTERHFNVNDLRDRHELYNYLAGWMRTLPPDDLAAAIQDLCRRYSVDATALSRQAAMDWTDVRTLAADPRVTVGSATVNYPALATLKEAAALREMTMGRQVTEAALGRGLPHFAYPVGDMTSPGRREIMLAGQAGFASAVTTRASVVQASDGAAPLALPRISWDGNSRALRTLRVLLSGVADPKWRPAAPSN